ncbi:hypothetical protein ACF1A5_15320 [Streptomyces sp. NPDC014864]|uniref:hypothetical protein n=1 Tax=Streptomyces sp. NPDC014864 TaxID=3364924 RepID=UPI0036FF0748
MLQELIECEAAARTGAEWNEHTKARTAYRNGLLRLVTAVLFLDALPEMDLDGHREGVVWRPAPSTTAWSPCPSPPTS